MDDDGGNRTNGQLNRFKARKILGVGDRAGEGSVSKIGQLLGNFASIHRGRSPLVIWWLRLLSLLIFLSVISSLAHSSRVPNELYAQILTICAFKLGISLTLTYASFMGEEEAIHVAIILVLAVYSFNAFASFVMIRSESAAGLRCGFDMTILACSYLIFRGIKLWTPFETVQL